MEALYIIIYYVFLLIGLWLFDYVIVSSNKVK